MKLFLIKIFLSLYLLAISSQESFGFVARLFSDAKTYCNSTKLLTPSGNLSSEHCGMRDLLPLKNSSFTQFIEKMDKKVFSDFNDISFAYKKSQVIVSQADEKIKEFKQLKNGLKKKLTPEQAEKVRALKQNAEIIASIDYKLATLKKSMPRCFVATDNACADKKENFIKKHLTPLITQRGQHLVNFPLLAQASAQSFIKEVVDKRLHNNQDKISKNFDCLQNKKIKSSFNLQDIKCKNHNKLKKELSTNLKFKFPDKSFKKTLSKSLNTAEKTTKDLSDRHQRVIEKVNHRLKSKKKRSRGKSLNINRKISGLRNFILHNTELTKDYIATIDDEEVEIGANFAKKFSCHLIQEHDLNKQNDMITSYALDAATLLIPLGGPLLFTKAISLANKANKIKKTRVLVGAEVLSMGIDTHNISNEHKKCLKLKELVSTLGKVSNRAKAEEKKCQKILNHLTMSYSLAMLGGGIGILPSVKKAFKLTPAGTERSERARELIARVKKSDFSTADNIATLKKARDLAKEQGITLSSKQEKAILAAHNLETGGRGITVAPDLKGGIKGKDTFTQGDHLLKQAILKEAKLPVDFRHALHRRGITGAMETVPTNLIALRKLENKLNAKEWFQRDTFSYYDELLQRNVQGTFYKNKNGQMQAFIINNDGQLVSKNLIEKEVDSMKFGQNGTKFMNDLRARRIKGPKFSLKDHPDPKYLKDERNFYAANIQEKIGGSFLAEVDGKHIPIEMVFNKKGDYSFVDIDSGEFVLLSAQQLKGSKRADGETLVSILAREKKLQQAKSDSEIIKIQENIAARKEKQMKHDRERTERLIEQQEKDRIKKIQEKKAQDEAEKIRHAEKKEKLQQEKYQREIKAASESYKKSLLKPMDPKSLRSLLLVNIALPKTGIKGLNRLGPERMNWIRRKMAYFNSPAGIKSYNELPLPQKKVVDQFREKFLNIEKSVEHIKSSSTSKIWAINDKYRIKEVHTKEFKKRGTRAKTVQVSRARPKQEAIGKRLKVSKDQWREIKFDPPFRPKDVEKAFVGRFTGETPRFNNLYRLLHFEPGSPAANKFLGDAYHFIKQKKNSSGREVNESTKKIRDFYNKRVLHYLNAVDPLGKAFPR